MEKIEGEHPKMTGRKNRRLPFKLIVGGIIAGAAACIWAIVHVDRSMSSIQTGFNEVGDSKELSDVLGPGLQELGSFPTAVYVLGTVGFLSLLVGLVLHFRREKSQ